GFGKQRLPGSWRADQQDAFRDTCAEASIVLGLLEEVDNLLELCLGLVDAGDVGESDAGVLLDNYLGAALAHVHQAAEPLLLGIGTEEPLPDGEEQEDRNNPGQQLRQPGILSPAAELDVVAGEVSG